MLDSIKILYDKLSDEDKENLYTWVCRKRIAEDMSRVLDNMGEKLFSKEWLDENIVDPKPKNRKIPDVPLSDLEEMPEGIPRKKNK